MRHWLKGWLRLFTLLGVFAMLGTACGSSNEQGETPEDSGTATSECEETATRGFAGTAHLDISGDTSSTDDLCVLSAAGIETDLGGFLFTWEGDAGLPSLTVSGPLETGTRPTSAIPPDPIVTLVVADDPTPVSFVSNDGTCSVTVDSVDASAVSGSLECSSLSTSDASMTIGVEATFEAAAT